VSIKVSELIVRCLEEEGVCAVFGLPGEEAEELLFSLDQSPILFVPCRHEQGAAFMANVWGRLTGRAGVCLSTLGPGATNLITGIADANLDKAPLVAITGQASRSRLHHESHQNLDVVSMFKPITKWNTAISAPDVVTEVVRKAFKIAEEEKPGATHFEVSEDLAAQKVPKNTRPLPRVRIRRPGPDYKAVGAAVELLKWARRPLVLAGNGAIRKLASRHLTRLVTRHDIPVVSTFMGKGALSDNREQSLFSTGVGFARDYVSEAVDAADLIVTVGYDVAELSPEKWNPKAQKTILHIDFTSGEVYAQYTPEVEIVGDISGTLWELDRRLENESLAFERGWYLPVRKRILEDIRSYDLEEGDRFTVPGVLNIVREVLDEDGVLISDVGSHKIWIARNFPTYTPNGSIISNGLASMGIALPGGIAAALIQPRRQVVTAMGDGGFLMNSQELETARRLSAKFTVLVFNDDDYGLISWKQRLSRDRAVGTAIRNPDFKAYAESFGIRGYRPKTVSELREVLRKVIGGGEMSVVEIPVDTEVNTELILKLKKHWGEPPEIDLSGQTGRL